MAVAQLDQSNLETTIQSNDTVIIDFWAPWCGPCRSFKPIFEEASERHPEVAFVACNTEEEQELAALFQIRSIPTIMIFRQGIPVFAQPGLLPAEMVDELLEKVGALDMDEVREKVQEAQQQAANG